MKEQLPERLWLAVAAEWTSKATTVAGQMVLPPLLGVWLDRLVGTVCLFLILGALLGFAGGMVQLVQWVRTGAESSRSGPPEDQPPPARSAASPYQPHVPASQPPGPSAPSSSHQGHLTAEGAAGPNQDRSTTQGDRK